MKTIKLLFVSIFIVNTSVLIAQDENEKYDAELAKQYEADEYGMKMYTLVLLTSGENEDDSEKRNVAFAAHMQNINALSEEGKLVLAGPFGKNDKDFRGIFILNTTDVAEAKSLLEADLAIQQKYLKAEYIPYYGSAALISHLEVHGKIWKTQP
ncbi:YciI family protein [Psychroflexus planctonicus]|uniref:YCII-related domain-containing protein n=1 Tax=Psychroflexus planctonicus TaxID=1526575 RepID=A0ABQ1SHX0_9FLAO|nr:YciI family protein [Psychroflexus planctonicus]GGE32822.1 hypothetical protein GCM10010832_11350 [Psychroflexus planctonicus]